MIDETFVVGTMPHPIGDHRCNECWAGFPKRCQCKGLIHAQFIKESWRGELNLLYSCDNCGANYKFPIIKKEKYKAKWKK